MKLIHHIQRSERRRILAKSNRIFCIVRDVLSNEE
jgi:hypothetical protein